MKEKPLPLTLFREVEKHFALPSVECVIIKDGGVVLVRRRMVPHQGFWTTPGAIILRGETFFDAAKRTAKREVNAEVEPIRVVGAFEMITTERHAVAVAVLCRYISGNLRVDGVENDMVKVFSSLENLRIDPVHKRMVVRACTYWRIVMGDERLSVMSSS